MPTIYTVNAKALLTEADSIERDANQSLPAWILLGHTDAYGKACATVRGLRAAAAEKSVFVRREILRNLGYTVLTPRAASSAFA